MIHFQFSCRGGQNQPVWKRQPLTMNPVLSHVENALCWTVFAPLVRARRKKLERRTSRELHDKARIDRVLNEIVEQHADLLC